MVTTNAPIITLRDVRFTYDGGATWALDGVSLDIRRGERICLTGPNGSGKSTLSRVIAGLVAPDEGYVALSGNVVFDESGAHGQLAKDSGEVYIKGKTHKEDRDSIKRSIGVVFQDSVLDKDLSVRDNLQSRAALYGITGKKFEKRVSKLAELLDFSDLMKRTVGKLSGGQRRRIDVARALLHKPEILILDEPTTGLDPKTRSLLWAGHR